MPHRLLPLLDDLRGRVVAALDWTSGLIASGLSMAAALGFVNIMVGLLSAAWLATQLYRFWRFEWRTLRRREARGELEG